MSDQAPAEVRRKRVSPFRFLQEVREEDAQGDLAVAPGDRDHDRNGVRDGGDRVDFLSGRGSIDPHCRYLRARHRKLKVQER